MSSNADSDFKRVILYANIFKRTELERNVLNTAYFTSLANKKKLQYSNNWCFYMPRKTLSKLSYIKEVYD